MTDAVKCPFCWEDDFDLIGLKMHFVNGWCEVYEVTQRPASQLPLVKTSEPVPKRREDREGRWG